MANAGPAKYRLDENDACQQVAIGKPDDGHHWDESVGHRMAQDCISLGRALTARGMQKTLGQN